VKEISFNSTKTCAVSLRRRCKKKKRKRKIGRKTEERKMEWNKN
jgi:hypothetical protein